MTYGKPLPSVPIGVKLCKNITPTTPYGKIIPLLLYHTAVSSTVIYGHLLSSTLYDCRGLVGLWDVSEVTEIVLALKDAKGAITAKIILSFCIPASLVSMTVSPRG